MTDARHSGARRDAPVGDALAEMRDAPARMLIQASSRSWAGGEDFCLREFEGAPAIAHTLAAAHRRFPATAIRIVAPEFDRGGRLEAVARSADGDVRALYGFDASPLDRMLMATHDLSDGDLILRCDGLHFSADFELAGSMLARARRERLDVVKTPDDFPPQLSVDVLRVGALRRARVLLPEQSPFLVHPKFLLASHPDFCSAHHQELPVYSEEWLASVRRKATIMLGEVERLEVGEHGRIAAGDQLSFHYQLAIPQLNARDRVLDVACGEGFGVRMLVEHCAEVIGVDLDAPSIAAAHAADSAGRGRYLVADATRMPFADDAFDVITSFETLEHVPAQTFLRECHRVLRPGGLLLLSTPQSCLGHIPFTPAHEHEYSLIELTELVKTYFEISQRIGLKAGTIWFEGDPVGTNSYFVCRRADSVSGR
jgi:2-polyprenyl-3-methyl-5-hydroxy-6-metoxy-1,4-benzoquinol methylase